MIDQVFVDKLLPTYLGGCKMQAPNWESMKNSDKPDRIEHACNASIYVHVKFELDQKLVQEEVETRDQYMNSCEKHFRLYRTKCDTNINSEGWYTYLLHQIVQSQYKSLSKGWVIQGQTRDNLNKVKLLTMDIKIHRQHSGLQDNGNILSPTPQAS